MYMYKDLIKPILTTASFCMCENTGEDQLRGTCNRVTDQYRYQH